MTIEKRADNPPDNTSGIAPAEKLSVPAVPYKKKHSLSISYAAVGMISFVDILANGLIVMILLILITVKANKDVREKEAESLRDVGVMMSRNIAAQVTTNALPTNPAAFLHDYYSSPLDINPDEAVMPIIEIHEDFVRFYYSGKTVAYEELFRQDNGLDNYLNRLSPAQSKFIRMDIYAIRPYYIVMSVLKEHGIEIRHWHLLGYNDNDKTKPTADPYQGDPSEPKKISADDASADRQKPTDSDPDGGNGKNRDSQRPPSMSAPAVPEDLLADNLSGIPGNGKNGGSGKDRESPSDNNNEGEPELTEEEAETLLKYLTELRRLMPEGSIPDFNAPPGKPDIEALKEFLKRLMQNARPQDEPLFRIPDDNALQMPLINPHAPAETHIPDPINSVTALLHYMYLKQTAYDSGVMQDISMNEFISYLGILESNPGMAEELPFYPLALNITSTLLYKAKTDNTADRQKLPLRNAPGATGYFPNELKLNKNNFPGAQDSALLTDEQQTVSVLKTVSAPVETEITVRRYPTAYKGEKVKLSAATAVIVPPLQKDPQEYRWRLVGILRNDLKNTLIGYSYIAFDETGKILLPATPNTLSISKVPFSYVFSKGIFDMKVILFLLYASAVMGVLWIYRRRLLP